MPGGFPIMSVYRPASTPEATTPTPTPAETASRRGSSVTESQCVNWASRARAWSDIHARAAEHYHANWAAECRAWSGIRARAVEHHHESNQSSSGMGSDPPTPYDHQPTATPASITPVAPPVNTGPQPSPLDIESQRIDWTHESMTWSRIRAQAAEHALAATPVNTTVSQPSPLDTDSQRIDWTHESIVWSLIRAQAAEHYQQYQLEREKERQQPESQEQSQAESEQAEDEEVPSTTEHQQQLQLEPDNEQDEAICLQILQRRQEVRGKAQAEREAKKARTAREAKRASSLATYKRLWSVSVFGLIVSGVLFIILFTNVLRAPKGGWLGVEATSNTAPSLTDGSIFSVVYWTAAIMDIVSVPAALLAAAKVAKLNEADAAYWHSLYDWSITGICVGALMALFPFVWALSAVVKGACEGGICLDLGLATLATISWTLLAFNAYSLFIKMRCGA